MTDSSNNQRNKQLSLIHHGLSTIKTIHQLDNQPRESYDQRNKDTPHQRDPSVSSTFTDNISILSTFEDLRGHKQRRRSSLSDYKESAPVLNKAQFDSTKEQHLHVYPSLFLNAPSDAKHGNTDKNDENLGHYSKFFGCTSVPIETDCELDDYFTLCQSAPSTSYFSSNYQRHHHFMDQVGISRLTKVQRWSIPFEPEWCDWRKDQTIFHADNDTCYTTYTFPAEDDSLKEQQQQQQESLRTPSYSSSSFASHSIKHNSNFTETFLDKRKSVNAANIYPGNATKFKLQSAKQACSLELRRIIDGLNEYVEHDLVTIKQGIIDERITLSSDTNQTVAPSEDIYHPTPFIVTLQDLIGYAQYALDTDLDVFLENRHLCAELVSKIQVIGKQWEVNKDWPCREWHVRLLLSIAALNRVIEWWQAEQGLSTSPLLKPVSTQEDVIQCQLQEEAKVGQSSTIVMELSLSSSTVQYLSQVWHDVIGTEPQSMIGLNMSQLLLAEDRNVFTVATNEMLTDNTKTAEVTFRVITSDNRKPIQMEGKGMLMRNRVTGEASHTMWVIKPKEPSLHLPTEKEDSLLPAKMKRGVFLSSSSLSGQRSCFESLMNLPPELCRICEKWVVAAFFEQHSELCVEIHRAEMDVVHCDDSLAELRQYVQSLRDVTVNELHDLENQTVISIDNSLNEIMFDDLGHIDQKKAEIEKYESLLDIMNVAISLKTPSDQSDEELLVIKSKTIEILYWTPPLTDDSDIQSLIADIQSIIQAKVDAVNRMQDRLDYNERIKKNFQQQVIHNENWSEFVAQENETVHYTTKESTDKCFVKKSCSAAEPLTATGEKPKEGGQNLKKSIFKKIREWKSKGKRSKISPKSSNISQDNTIRSMDLVATEFIDTPLASPKSFSDQQMSRKGSLPHRIQQQEAGKSPCSPLPAPIAGSRSAPPSIKDYEIIKPISKGAFGSVFLAKKRITGDYYAIKFLKKSDMIAKNQVTNVKAERMIMIAQTDSPYVAKLYYTFQSKDYLYLVMEYLNGGDCSSLIKVMGSLPYDWARNYLAEVTLGLSYLHSKNIIHRDLKPDNLLIDQNGHLKLTDFGLSRVGFLDRRVRDELHNGPLTFCSPSQSHCGTPPRSPSVSSASPSGAFYKNTYFNFLFDQDRHRRGSLASSTSGGEPSSLTSISPFLQDASSNISDDGFGVKLHRQRTNSGLLSGRTTPGLFPIDGEKQEGMVGTPDYLAPESILGTSQDSMVDWWALGVICYEFLFGYPPFHAETPDKVFENILSGAIDWHEDEISIPPEARDFIERLLTPDPNQRLGRNGADEVRNHPFFKGLDWDNLLSEVPSFIPQPLSEEDTDYFDLRGASMLMPEDVEHLVLEEVKRAKAIIVEQNPEKTSLINQQDDDEGRPHITNDADFGTFVYKNLPLLEKANEEAIKKIRSESVAAAATENLKLPLDVKRHSIIDALESQNISISLPNTPPLTMSPSISSRPSISLRRSADVSNPQLEKVKKTSVEDHGFTLKRTRSISFSNRPFEHQPHDEPPDHGSGMVSLLPTSRHPLDCSHDTDYKETRSFDCLIADDNPISCKILETILKSLHCRCVVARNGAQAIRYAMGDKVIFDFIFMDIRMPIIDGEASARMIKSTNNINRNTPIIAFTAYERTFHLTKIFDDVLSKPVTRESVIRCIKQFNDLPLTNNTNHQIGMHWSYSSPTLATPPFIHTPQEILSPPVVKEKNHIPHPILTSQLISAHEAKQEDA